MQLLACVLLLLSTLDATASIQPSLSCWYTSYATGTAVPTVILGYTNNGNTSLVVTDPNVITPSSYNGNQPTLFLSGTVPYAYYIALTGRVTLTWVVGDAILTVAPEQLNEATRCINTVYASQCPTSVVSFCDDGSYCNGNEICFADVMGGQTGACYHTTEVVTCPDGLVCSEVRRACVLPVTQPPPTDSPTRAPTKAPTPFPTVVPTPRPTNAQTTPPTLRPTGAPTEALLYTTTCTSDVDCRQFDNFCDGSYVCNELTTRCIEADANYDPCTRDRHLLRKYYATLSNESTTPVSVVCDKSARLCVESVSCGTNLDCSDGLVCNGVEQCIAGQCYYQHDQSINAVCETSRNMTCSEPDGCSPVNSEFHPPGNTSWNHTGNHTRDHLHINPSLLGILVGGITLVGLLLIFGFMYFEFNKSDYTELPTNVTQQQPQQMKRPFAKKFGHKFNNKYGVKQQ